MTIFYFPFKDNIVPWPKTQIEIFKIFALDVNVKTGIHVPKIYEHFLTPLNILRKKWLKSGKCQYYTTKVAMDMADKWNKCIGTIGTNGDSKAVGLKSLSISLSNLYNNDIYDIYSIMVNQILNCFINGSRFPRYHTDYHPIQDLLILLRKNNLTHLCKHFPWKTSFEYDFNIVEIPKIVDYENLDKCVNNIFGTYFGECF